MTLVLSECVSIFDFYSLNNNKTVKSRVSLALRDSAPGISSELRLDVQYLHHDD